MTSMSVDKITIGTRGTTCLNEEVVHFKDCLGDLFPWPSFGAFF